MFPRCLFYELLDSVRGYLLNRDLLFYRLYLGLRLFDGETLVINFVYIVKGRTSFEPKMLGGKANSFKRGNMGLFCGEIHGCT